MYRVGGLFIAALFASGSAAFGQDVSGQVKAKDGVKSSYSISNDQTTVTTVASDVGTKYDSKMDGYLFPSLKSALDGMAFVTSVMQTNGEETTETTTWADYDTKKRKSHAFLKLALQSPVTLLFEVEESYRKCKTAAKTTTTYDMYDGASSSTCSKQSEITVRGPIAVYGNYASAINVDSLLRNKQELTLTLSKDYSGKNTQMATKFLVKSVSFDESLARFFRVFNIPVFASKDDVSYGNSILDKVSPLTSRQRLMLGISRVARTANERILN